MIIVNMIGAVVWMIVFMVLAVKCNNNPIAASAAIFGTMFILFGGLFYLFGGDGLLKRIINQRKLSRREKYFLHFLRGYTPDTYRMGVDSLVSGWIVLNSAKRQKHYVKIMRYVQSGKGTKAFRQMLEARLRRKEWQHYNNEVLNRIG